MMNRREALKRMAVLTGGALSISTVAGVLGGCTSKSGAHNFQTLSDHQNKLVTVLSERIIPQTDTPGAKAAGVNQFVDKMLTDWHTKEERDYFLSGLDHVDETSNQLKDQAFLDLNEQDQIAVMQKLQDEAETNPRPVSVTDLPPFFHKMKEFTIVGYYTSEVGATEELKTRIIPGHYDGCMPYSDIGTAWSNAAT